MRYAAILVALVTFAGCDADDDTPPGESPSAWLEVETTQFRGNGESETVAIPAQGPVDAVALRATSDAEVCFQLSSAVDGFGHALNIGRSAGPYCRGCELRTSIAASAGVFIFPTQAGFESHHGLSLQFARINCETLTPLKTPDDQPPLQVEVQPIRTSKQAAIDLRFLVADTSILHGDESRQLALLTALHEELASAGIAPRVVETLELDTFPTQLQFHTGDPSALADALAEVPAKAETTIDIVFGGCLRYDDPIFGPPHPVNGFTPRIPGGAGPADAVFMPGLNCSTEEIEDLPVHTQAHVLAHELGHYLGLYHSVESDGTSDQLVDTGPDNIMHFNPQRAAAIDFSASQGHMMRMHPAVVRE